ncbi:MAG: hypothetical protein RBR67_05055 [Desulfobacterium sp.]|nr:hypothetical protein [Desulfobacterium sp.]
MNEIKTDSISNTCQQDRRKNQDRRRNSYRRSEEERRHDFRKSPDGKRKPIRIWLHSIIKPRLGIDRRKGRRRLTDRRRFHQHPILTQEEISELLSH